MGDNPIMKAAQLDDRRRLVMPPECPANSTVTVDQVDDNTWLIRRHTRTPGVKMVAIPAVRRLRDDPEWEALEEEAAQHCAKQVPPLQE